MSRVRPSTKVTTANKPNVDFDKMKLEDVDSLGLPPANRRLLKILINERDGEEKQRQGETS